MALRSGYKGYKKLAEGLKEFWPGILGADIPALKKTFLDWSSYAKTGAVNWLPHYTSADASLTMTDSDNGFHVVGSTSGYKAVRWTPLSNLKKNTDYTLYDDVAITSGLTFWEIKGSNDGSSWTVIKDTSGITTSVSQKIDFNTGNYNYWQFNLYVMQNSGVNADMTFSGMSLQLAGTPRLSNTPYAMTNEELTGEIQGKNGTFTPSEGFTVNNLLIKERSHIVALSMYLECGNITSGTWVDAGTISGVDMPSDAVRSFAVTIGKDPVFIRITTTGDVQLYSYTELTTPIIAFNMTYGS